MLAKPSKIAGDCRVTKIIARSCADRRGMKAGGTASAKRTQGSDKAAGDFAPPLRLIQPRKQRHVGVNPVTLRVRQYRHERHGERVPILSGSSKIVAGSQRSVNNDELPVPFGRTGAPRTREALLPFPASGQAVCIQLEEVASRCGKESDPPIVVRDGRADHMAKEWAERQREHSTHRGRRMLPVSVSSTLLAIVADIWFTRSDAKPSARLSEEPCAGKPHAGICEGGAR